MKSKSRRRTSIGCIANSRWAAYATAGAASAFVCAESADAAIHHVVVGLSFGGATNYTALAFPLDQPGDQFSLAWERLSSGGAGAAFFAVQGNVSTGMVGNAAGNFRYPFKLNAGANIAGGPFITKNGSNFATLAFGGGYTNSHWLTTGTGYVGFRFDGGAGVEYGWAQISLDTGPDQNEFTLIDYAWGDPGDVFNAGDLTLNAVPEPATFGVGLLATGAIGVAALRKRRAAAAK